MATPKVHVQAQSLSKGDANTDPGLVSVKLVFVSKLIEHLFIQEGRHSPDRWKLDLGACAVALVFVVVLLHAIFKTVSDRDREWSGLPVQFQRDLRS